MIKHLKHWLGLHHWEYYTIIKSKSGWHDYLVRRCWCYGPGKKWEIMMPGCGWTKWTWQRGEICDY